MTLWYLDQSWAWLALKTCLLAKGQAVNLGSIFGQILADPKPIDAIQNGTVLSVFKVIMKEVD